MKCLVCGKMFNEKRNLYELFRTKKYNVCIDCIKANPINIEFNYIPLDNHTLEIVSLFENNKIINYEGFHNEYEKIYMKLVESKKNSQIIFSDSFILDEKTIGEYNEISRNIDKDILVLTNVLLE